MDKTMMGGYCLMRDSAPKGYFKNGSINHFRQLATYFNKLESGKKPQWLDRVKFGFDARKSWIFGIKILPGRNKNIKSMNELFR